MNRVVRKKMWPTPQARDWKGSSGRSYKGLEKDLPTAAKQSTGMWPTPNASDNRDRGNLSDPAIQRRIKLGKQVGLTMAVKENKGGGTLNPTWVEWLMGYPAGYTDLKDWEILSSRKSRKKSVEQS
jgi:DNA (cytosine-5)-methyltransferase 1